MWFAAALAGLAALFAAALCIPVDLTFRLDACGRLDFSVRLVWLFGLVGKKVGKKDGTSAEQVRAVRRRGAPDRGRGNAGAVFGILRTEGLAFQLLRLLGDVLRRLKVRELTLDFRVGLDDPADTGLLFGLIAPAALFLGQALSRPISVRPAFDAAVLEGYCQGSVGVRPIGLMPPLFRFILSRPVSRLVGQAVSSRWKHRE